MITGTVFCSCMNSVPLQHCFQTVIVVLKLAINYECFFFQAHENSTCKINFQYSKAYSYNVCKDQKITIQIDFCHGNYKTLEIYQTMTE